MKDLMLAARAFMFFTISFAFFLCIAFLLIYGMQTLDGLIYIILGSLCAGLIMSVYLLIGFIMFRKRWFYYKNIEMSLKEQNVQHVIYESVAGDANSKRIKYGALFLTEESVLFIPHRFAIKSLIIVLPLEQIKYAKKKGINFQKFFAGGLRNRLDIELENGKHYEFSVWEIDTWVNSINKKKNDIRGT